MAEISDDLAPVRSADHAAVSGDGGGGVAAERANDGAKVLGVVGQPAAPSWHEFGGERDDVTTLRRS